VNQLEDGVSPTEKEYLQEAIQASKQEIETGKGKSDLFQKNHEQELHVCSIYFPIFFIEPFSPESN
jgi:hypothetical protein